jgi:hypothetical protein
MNWMSLLSVSSFFSISSRKSASYSFWTSMLPIASRFPRPKSLLLKLSESILICNSPGLKFDKFSVSFSSGTKCVNGIKGGNSLHLLASLNSLTRFSSSLRLQFSRSEPIRVVSLSWIRNLEFTVFLLTGYELGELCHVVVEVGYLLHEECLFFLSCWHQLGFFLGFLLPFLLFWGGVIFICLKI